MTVTVALLRVDFWFDHFFSGGGCFNLLCNIRWWVRNMCRLFSVECLIGEVVILYLVQCSVRCLMYTFACVFICTTVRVL